MNTVATLDLIADFRKYMEGKDLISREEIIDFFGEETGFQILKVYEFLAKERSVPTLLTPVQTATQEQQHVQNKLQIDVMMTQMQRFLWFNLYKKLQALNYSMGQVFMMEHTKSTYKNADDSSTSDEYPPDTTLFEATEMIVASESSEKPLSFIRIWEIQLPSTDSLIFGDGESFEQYYEYARSLVWSIHESVHSPEELFTLISGERERHNNQAYATIGGQRDKLGNTVLYMYWAEHYFFTAELRIDEFEEGQPFPLLYQDILLFPHPVYLTKATRFRKFRYLGSERQ